MPPRKARKRRPKNIPPKIEEAQPSRKLSGTVKLSASYLRQEAEVEEELSKRPGINDSLNDEEAITFFVSQLQSPEDLDIPIGDTLSSPQSTDHEDPTRLASSYIQPEYLDSTQRTQIEVIEYDDSLLYIPSSSPVKELQTEFSQNPAGDGLYIPSKPKVNNKNLNRLVNRLLEEDDSELLNNTQELKGMQSFIVDTNLYCIESTKEFRPIFVDPIPLEKTNTVVESFHDKILKIELINLQFNCHRLFSPEQQVAKKLEMLFHQYAGRQNNKIVAKISSKLNVIRQLLNTSQNDTNQYEKYVESLQDLRFQYHRECRIDRDLTKSILLQWKELKQMASNNVFPIKLKINVQEVDTDADLVRWNEQFDLELSERESEAIRFYEKEKRKLRRRRDNDGDFQSIRKPQPPDIEEIRSQLLDIYQESVRPPGEPIISLELKHFATANLEKLSSKYSVTFVLDNELRVDSKFKSLHSDGSVDYNVIYGFKLIRTVPKLLKAVITEQEHFRPARKLVELFVPVPNDHELFGESKRQMIEFTAIRNRGVQGVLSARVGWHAASSNDLPVATVNAATSILCNDENQVAKWYDDQLLDPMDPEAEDLIFQSNKAPKEQDYGDYFMLNEELSAFCTEEDLMSNERLNVLFARFNNDLKVRDQKMIPSVEREVELPDEHKIIEDLNWISPIDLERHNGRKYLKEMYKTIENYCSILNEDTESQELLVVGEDEITIGSVFESIVQFFSPRRPLKPTFQSSSSSGIKMDVKHQNMTDFNLIINVNRVNGIPVRVTNEEQARQISLVSPANTHAHGFINMVTVCPYISVTFKDKTIRTATASGSSPTWNEQIIIPIHKTMIDSKDYICISIFDEFVEDLLGDENDRFTEIYQRISSKFIGELLIPYSTLHFSQRMNGTFMVSTPKMLVGYIKPTITTPDTTIMVEPPEVRDSILMNLCISLEPSIEVPRCSTACLECTETMALQGFIQNWIELYKEEFPKRFIDPFVTLSSGKRVLLTRMLCPLQPPFEKDISCEFLSRRYVSLIPVINSLNTCSQLTGVWLSNDEILSLGTASSKDLGVLLSCFCISIGLKSWLLLGSNKIHGESTFVLVQQADEFSIIDPTTGFKYSAKDVNCPVTKVVYIVNDSNIWANIQKESRPFMSNFDVKRSICWRPLFTNKQFTAPEDPVHDVNFEYGLSFECKELQRIIEKKIVKKINYWRGHRKTIWNGALSENLRQILVAMESDLCFNVEQDYLQQLGALSIYKVTGFPINMPYISLSRVVERVKATGIHLNTDNRVEFAMAVYVHVYPMNVLSVWVFLSSLVPRVQYITNM